MLTISVDRHSDVSLQWQIFQTVNQALLQGELPFGAMLPSIRKLSQSLGVARVTVTMAYEKLVLAGYVRNCPGIGYEVIFRGGMKKPRAQVAFKEGEAPLRLKPASVANDVYSPITSELYCRLGVPDPRAFPWAAWRKWNNSASSAKHHLLTRYHSPQGLESLRLELVSFLRLTRGIETKPDNIIIVNGIQEGISLLVQLFTANASRCKVVTESPCYSGAWHLFNYHRADLTAVPVDEWGMQVERLPQTPTQLCYITPSHQYPVGGTLPLARRSALLAWAMKTGAYLIEDDYDSVFSYGHSPLPALKSMDDADRVFYLGTFSKTLGPGTRMGYMVCPEAVITSVQTIKALSDSGSNWLMQQFLADFMHGQSYYTHLRKLEQEYAARQQVLIDGLLRIFPLGRILGVAAGIHLALSCPFDYQTARALRERCLRANVRFDTLEELSNGSERAWLQDNANPLLFFGFGALNCRQLAQVLAVIQREWDLLRADGV